MSVFKIVKYSSMWSTAVLTEKVEQALVEKERDGWTVVSVAFGMNIWLVPTAFVTLKRE